LILRPEPGRSQAKTLNSELGRHHAIETTTPMTRMDGTLDALRFAPLKLKLGTRN
jgi:hypothetical protein